MKQLYFKQGTKFLFCFAFLFSLQQIIAQAPSPGTMEFGSSLTVLSNSTNPSADASVNSLLNNFDVSGVSSNSRFIAFANSGNEGGTDAIGGLTDHVLTWTGNVSGTFTSGTMSSDTGEEFGLTAMEFAYAISTGAAPTVIAFTFQGKKDDSIVGTLVLNSPPHNTEINIDFTTPTTGSFADIDEIVIIPATPISGGFSVDEMVIIAAVSNTDPTINIDNSTLAYTEGDAATQIDDAGTISDVDGDADWNGGTLQVQITANNEAADEISVADTDGDGTAITISGTNILANGTDIGDLSTSGGIVTNGTMLTITFDNDATNTLIEEVLQSLRYRNTSSSPSTSNRTITVTANDTNGGSANDTRTVSVIAAPDVSNVVVPTNDTYITGEDLTFSVVFNENINVNTTGGTPQLNITIGSTSRQATYISGSGTVLLLFRYTIQSDEIDTDGIVIGTLDANGGTLQNSSGTNANLTLNGVGSTSGVLVDAVAPTVTSVTVPSNATYITGQNLDFTVNFNENITVNTTGGTPQVTITIGSNASQATYQSGSGTSALLFRYTVQTGELDTDGIAIGTLAANGGTLQDAADNNANLTLNSVGSTTNVLVDAVAPVAPTVVTQTTSDVTPEITGTNALGTALPSGETMTVTVNGAIYNVVPNASGNWSLDTELTTPSSGVLGPFVNGISYEVVATATDLAGNSASDTTSNELTIDTSLNLEEGTLSENDFVFTNPVENDFVIISAVKIKAITVYNLGGANVAISIGNSADVSKLTSGIYIAVVTTENGQYIPLKILKK